jgi:hypothetical protein
MSFKVMEGGGRRPPEDFDVKLAAQTLRFLTIELLRAIVHGHDPENRVTDQLIELYKRLGKDGIMVDTVVKTLLQDLHSELAKAGMSGRDSDDADREIEHVVLASFQVTAERLGLDDAAQGRTSQRTYFLRRDLRAPKTAIQIGFCAPNNLGRVCFWGYKYLHEHYLLTRKKTPSTLPSMAFHWRGQRT